MEIPFLTNFIEGLKLFFESKRLKWLTVVFFIGAFSIYLLERIVFTFFPAAGIVATLIGAIFPLFFILTAFLSLLGLQRFIASDESYKTSLIYTIIWLAVSIVFFILTASVLIGFLLVVVFVGFFSWIAFQGYFSTRTSLSLASSIQIEHRSKGMTLLLWFSNIFNYVILIGAVIVTIFLYGIPSLVAIVGAVFGLLIAVVFNLINGIIITKERNKSTADNLALLGFFVSMYCAYFLYNVLKPVDLSIYNLDGFIGLGITIFFLLYTMSGVGRSLASRAELDTRWKLSKELGATFTFFLASCYVFVDVMFTTLVLGGGGDPAAVAPMSDIIKLWVFPMIALLMEINFIRKSRKVLETPETPDDLPVVPVEEVVYDESGEVVEEESPAVEETPMTPSITESVEPETEYSDESSESEVENDSSETDSEDWVEE